jgi:hypothetical protein
LTSNDEVERRAGAQTQNQDGFSQSSIPFLGSLKTPPRDRSNCVSPEENMSLGCICQHDRESKWLAIDLLA